MDTTRLSAWIYGRQGLNGDYFAGPVDALAGAGWQRSVGGVSPYIALFARCVTPRSEVDAGAARLELFELPSARGCTYLLPSDHFALGLALGRPHGSATEVATARKLGVEDSEIDALKSAVISALVDGPLSPADLKPVLGDRVRNLGEEGKKRGLTTTLPLALGLLQTQGIIRRSPLNGRLDTQRYAYELWQPAIDTFPTEDEVATACARLFFTWIGAATLKEFRDFSLFTAKAARAACDNAGVSSFQEGTDLLSLLEARAEFDAFEVPQLPQYSLICNLDSFFLLRRGSHFWLGEADARRAMPTDKGLKPISELSELWSHAILDRGRLIGIWEFDPDAGRIVWHTWIAPDDALLATIEATQRYICEDLGDARSFSLDSPASRRPRLDAIADLHKSHGL